MNIKKLVNLNQFLNNINLLGNVEKNLISLMVDEIGHRQIVKTTLFQNLRSHSKYPTTIEQLENFHPFLYTCNIMLCIIVNY